MCNSNMLKYLALFFLLVPCSNVQGFSYLYPYSLANLQIAPSVYTGDLSLPLGEMEGAPSAWHIAQWGIVEDLLPTIDCLGNCYDNEWQVANTYAAIHAKDG